MRPPGACSRCRGGTTSAHTRGSQPALNVTLSSYREVSTSWTISTLGIWLWLALCSLSLCSAVQLRTWPCGHRRAQPAACPLAGGAGGSWPRGGRAATPGSWPLEGRAETPGSWPCLLLQLVCRRDEGRQVGFYQRDLQVTVVAAPLQSPGGPGLAPPHCQPVSLLPPAVSQFAGPHFSDLMQAQQTARKASSLGRQRWPLRSAARVQAPGSRVYVCSLVPEPRPGATERRLRRCGGGEEGREGNVDRWYVRGEVGRLAP